MPLQKIQFKPGIVREVPTLSNEGGWYDGDKIRFRFGFPEKIGGWAALTYTTFLGVCRSLWNWTTLKGFNVLGIGTNLKFYLEDGSTYYDITPIRQTTVGQATFSANVVTPSSILTVSDPLLTNLQPGDFVSFSNAVGLAEQTYTADDATDTLTFSSSIPNGTPVTLYTTGSVPGGLSLSQVYYIVDASGVTAKLSLTLSGPAVDITTTGTGVQTIAPTTGITREVLNQEYQIISALSSTSYTISARVESPISSPGASVLSTPLDIGDGGTAVQAQYQINTGQAIYTYGTGWGAGPWSRDGWGSGYITGVGLQLRLWSQSNFGEQLLFSPRGGALYVWDPGPGTIPAYTTRGTLVSGGDCPSILNQIMVSDSTRIVIAFGCNDYGSGALDPMLIRWSEQESYVDWTPSATNQAGSYRLSKGSDIVGALQTRQEILVWTDAAVYSMQYLGPPFVWGFNILADNISIAGPNAMATASGVTYWMGVDKFYVYSGRVDTLPCSVRQYVFNDMNKLQQYQFFAGTNEGYNEIWWFYCSANSNVIDRYVIFNYLEKAWYYGALPRTAWLDSPLRPFPIAATTNNLIVYHESGVDDGSTNPPSPIVAYIQSSDFDIGEGDRYSFVWRMVPDLTFNGSTTPSPSKPQVNFTLLPRKNPGSPYGVTNSPTVRSDQSYGTARSYLVQEYTNIVYTRVRGRELSFKISSDTLGTQWQLGSPAIDIRNDGRNA